jgi:hypothetical protein
MPAALKSRRRLMRAPASDQRTKPTPANLAGRFAASAQKLDWSCALRGIRSRLTWVSRQPVRRLAAGNQTVPLTKVVSGGEGILCLRRKTTLRRERRPGAPTLQQPACGLTLRSAATPHGKPLGRRGAFAYAAPRRPSTLPRGSRLAQTLARTAKPLHSRVSHVIQCRGA